MSCLILVFALFNFPFFSNSDAEKPQPAERKICLNMIVKDEAPVIKRCLKSVKPLIDYWVIVDTGSTDGTQKIIKEFMKEIPGELYERPWKNFGESRTEAFNLAKGKAEYLLFMDADDILEYSEGFQLTGLVADSYNLWRGTKEFSYLKPQLVRAHLPWKWIGVTHEYLHCDQPYTSEILNEVKYISCDGGARSKGLTKFYKNIELLTDGLKKEPNNSRYMFYLAESYRDAGEKAKALESYQKLINMGSWDEEIFWSKLQIAHILRDMGFPSNIVIQSYQNAHEERPHRVEPIYYLAEFYNHTGQYHKAYECLKSVPSDSNRFVKDYLFNEDWISSYGLQFQRSISAYYVGHFEESLQDCEALLLKKDLPEGWKKIVESNLQFPIAKLGGSP